MSGSATLLILQLIVFVAVFLAVGALGFWLSSGSQIVERRLREATQVADKRTEREVREGAFNVRWDESKHKVILPVSEWQKSSLRSKLVYAGFRQENSLNILLTAKGVLAIALPVLIVIPMFILGWFQGQQIALVVVWMVTAAFLGYLLPDLYLAQKGSERRQELAEVFPDVLDLLVVCVEAGLGLDAAIQRVSVEIGRSSKAMEDELLLLTLETRAGKSRQEALLSLAERTQLQDIKSLVSILIQAENFGTSVGDALRDHAMEMREVRIQRAREKAAKLPVTLTFPILIFIFPALFLVILGPAVANIFVGLGGLFGG